MFWLTHLAGHCIQKGPHCSSASHLTLSLVLDEVTTQPFEELDLLAACASSVLVSWFQIASNLLWKNTTFISEWLPSHCSPKEWVGFLWSPLVRRVGACSITVDFLTWTLWDEHCIILNPSSQQQSKLAAYFNETNCARKQYACTVSRLHRGRVSGLSKEGKSRLK